MVNQTAAKCGVKAVEITIWAVIAVASIAAGWVARDYSKFCKERKAKNGCKVDAAEVI